MSDTAAPQRPMIGDWEVPSIEAMKTRERRAFVELPVPGRAGSLFHDSGSEPTVIEIAGSVFGDENRNGFVEQVRGKFAAGEPLTFVADIVTATQVQYVIIEDLRFQQSATRPGEASFWMLLRECPPPPPPPDPFGGIDAGLLDAAAGFVDSVSSALDALDALANIPDFSDPTKPLAGVLGGVEAIGEGLGQVSGLLDGLFGEGT